MSLTAAKYFRKMKSQFFVTILLLTILVIVDFNKVTAGCDGLRRLSCHIHCNLKGLQCIWPHGYCQCETFEVGVGDGANLHEGVDDRNLSETKLVMVVAPMATWVYLVPVICAMVQILLIVFALYKCGFFKRRAGTGEHFGILTTEARGRIMPRSSKPDREHLIEHGEIVQIPYASVPSWTLQEKKT